MPSNQPTNAGTPWTLDFDRDGTEDFLTISCADGHELVRSSFIPGLHDVCMLFEKTTQQGGTHV